MFDASWPAFLNVLREINLRGYVHPLENASLGQIVLCDRVDCEWLVGTELHQKRSPASSLCLEQRVRLNRTEG
jgi:hypothetical protein